MSDFTFCQNCQKVSGIRIETDQAICLTCGERICIDCGCTENEPCADDCSWVNNSLCSKCYEKGLETL